MMAGKINSLPVEVLFAVVATGLTAFSTIFMVDRSGTAAVRPQSGQQFDWPVPSVSSGGIGAVATAAPAAPKILISYHAADRNWARWITRQLTSYGYVASNRTWPTQLPSPATEAAEPANGSPPALTEHESAAQVAKHLRGYDCVLFLVSQAYLETEGDGQWWQRSVMDALADRSAATNPGDASADPGTETSPLLILPVLVEACDLEPAVSERIVIDLTAEPDADGCKEELVGMLGENRLPPPHPQAATIDVPLPGRGPSLSNLPALDASFVGRRNDLDTVYALLHSERPSDVADPTRREHGRRGGPTNLRAAVVHGLGGVGKSELAVQYAWEHADEYELVWWVQAKTPVSAINDLIELAKLLNLGERANHDEVVLNLWAELRQRDRWLLIFDDVDEPDSIRGAYWPTTKRGHVLITSRAATGWESLTSDRLELGPLTPEESEGFLVRRVPEAAEKPELARQVAASLGYLPLALAQAAAYILGSGSSLEAFHELLRDRFDEVIAASKRKTDEVAGGYSLLLIMSVESRGAAARDLLALLSMFNPSGIPRRMISDHADVLPEQLAEAMRDQFTNDKTVGALRKFSLIEAFSDRFNVHEVVQSTVRSTLTPEEQRQWCHAAVHLLCRAFPRYPDEPDSWGSAAFLMPHVEAARRIAERLGEQDETTARLLVLAGRYLHARCDWRQAQKYLRGALAIRTGLGAQDDLGTAECFYYLGQAQFPLAQLKEARAYIEKALAIRRMRLEPNHSKIAQTLTHLAEIVREFATENDLAIRYTEEAEQILREIGANEADIADTLLIRGTILRNAGRLSDALAAQQQSLELNERVRSGGPSSVEAGQNHANLGVIRRDLGQWERARDEFEIAIAIMEPILGPDHLEVAQAKKYLGDILRRTGELALAYELINEVTEIHRRRPGEAHKLAACLAKLGSVQHALGDPQSARQNLESALATYERTYGVDHPYSAKVLSRLGPVYLAVGRANEAEQTLLRALRIFETCYGPTHPALVWVLQSLAGIHGLSGDGAAADALKVRATRIQRLASA